MSQSPLALFDEVCQYVRQTSLLTSVSCALEWEEKTVSFCGHILLFCGVALRYSVAFVMNDTISHGTGAPMPCATP